MGRKPKYATDEERRLAKLEQIKQFYERNPNRRKEYQEKYKGKYHYSNRYIQNKDVYIKRSAEWQKNNPERYKISHDRTVRKQVIKKRIKERGEEEWLTKAIEEDLTLWLEYKAKHKLL